jgi:hypothetical protein
LALSRTGSDGASPITIITIKGTLPFIAPILTCAGAADGAEAQGAAGEGFEAGDELPQGSPLSTLRRRGQFLGLVALGQPGRPVIDGREPLAPDRDLRENGICPSCAMGSGARPRIALGPADQVGADGIALDLA